jgi:branched-chain amino acid transport system substrate-binding protein
MKRTLTLLIATLALCAAQADVIKIGALLPLSGEYDFVGKANQEGMQMALSEAEGKTKHQYKVIYEDTGFVPGRTSLAAQKLINIDRVDILTSLWSVELSAVEPIADAKKIPNFAQDYNLNDLPKHKYTFKISQPCDVQAAMQTKIIERLRCKRVAILWQYSADWMYAIPYLLAEIRKDPSLEIVANEKFISPTRDFRTMLAKINEERPDILVVWSLLPESEIILRQSRELGMKYRISGYYEDLNEKKLGEGMHFFCATNPAGAWVAAYKERFHKEPAYGVNLGYDQMQALIKVYESFDHKPDGLALIDKATHLPPWVGASGICAPRPDRMIAQAFKYVKYENGQMVPDPLFEDLNKEMGW